MSLFLVTPSGESLPVPASADAEATASSSKKATLAAAAASTTSAADGVLWRTLGRGEHGIPVHERLVSRTAAELLLMHSSSNSFASPLRIKVLGRNSLLMQMPAAANSTADSVTHPITSGTIHDWPVGATLYLLHATKYPKMYAFTLCRHTMLEPSTLSLLDADSTQDVGAAASQLHAPINIKIERANSMHDDGEDAPASPVRLPMAESSPPPTASKLPATPASASHAASHRSHHHTPAHQHTPASAAVHSQTPLTPPPAGGYDMSLAIPATPSAAPTTASQLPNSEMTMSQAQQRKKRPFKATQDEKKVERKEDDARKTNAASSSINIPASEPIAVDTNANAAGNVDIDMMLADMESFSHQPDDEFALDDIDEVQPIHDYAYASEPRPDPNGANAPAGGDGDGNNATAAGEPATKKQRTAHVVQIKRSLDFLSTPSSSAASSSSAAPLRILTGYALYVLSEGIGGRQLEIVNQNIIKRGGLILHEFPKHRQHTTIDKDVKLREKKRIAEIAKKRGKAEAEAEAQTQKSMEVGEKKYPIIIIVAPSVRTKRALQDIIAMKLRHQSVTPDSVSSHLLGIPKLGNGRISPTSAPQSPKTTGGGSNSTTNSPTLSVASGSSNASNAITGSSIKLRRSWQIHHLEWLVEAFKRNTLLPRDMYLLDDDGSGGRRLDFPAPASVGESSAATTAIPHDTYMTDVNDGTATAAASSSYTAAATSSSSAAAAGANPDDDSNVADDTEDFLARKYSDEADDQFTSATGIAKWNGAIAAQLRETAEKYNAQAGQHFRAIAFRRAGTIISSLTFALKDASALRNVKGMGSSTLHEVETILKTGHSERLTALQSDPVLKVHQLLQTVHGIGPKTAEKFYAQGIRTIEDLKTKAKLNAQQQTYLQYYDELGSPIPRIEVSAFERSITSVLHSINPQLQLVVCGSYRRGKSTCGDIDCLITHPDAKWIYKDASMSHSSHAFSVPKTATSYLLEELTRRLHEVGILTDDLVTPSNNARHKSFKSKNIYESNHENEMYCGIGYLPYDAKTNTGGMHRRLDLKIYHIEEFPTAILYFTGSKDFNRYMRLYCNTKFGYSLSDKALSPYIRKGAEKVVSGLALPCANEAEIFAHIKLPYIPPTERDHIPAAFMTSAK